MRIETYTEELRTKGQDDCVDITEIVQAAVARVKLRQGLATVFVTGSTAGVTTIEYEPGLVQDLKAAVRRLFPESLLYAHHEAAGDDNGFSHLRAAFIPPRLFAMRVRASLPTNGRQHRCVVTQRAIKEVVGSLVLH